MSNDNLNETQTWSKIMLSEIVECLDGRRVPVKKQDRSEIVGMYPYYGASGIIDYVDDYIFDEDLILLGEDGENVISRNVPLAFKITGRNWVNNHAHVFKPKPNHNIDFITYLLESRDYTDIVSGSAQPKLNQQNLMRLIFVVPDYETQIKIASILSTADAVIEKTQAAIAKYKAIKQGMLQDLFTRGILTKDIKYKDKNGTWVERSRNQLRPSYQDAPELYKESKLGWIPKEWEVETVGEVCTMKSGEGITSKSIYEMSDFPVYGGNGLRGFTNSYTHDGEYTLVGRQGALCGNITRVSGKFYASEHAVVVTVEKEIDVDWLSQKLNTMNLNQYSEASAQPGLSVNKILRLPILKPTFGEQKDIAKRLIAIDNKLQTEQNFLHKQQQIKAGLMADLLSGRKKVIYKEIITANE